MCVLHQPGLDPRSHACMHEIEIALTAQNSSCMFYPIHVRIPTTPRPPALTLTLRMPDARTRLQAPQPRQTSSIVWNLVTDARSPGSRPRWSASVTQRSHWVDAINVRWLQRVQFTFVLDKISSLRQGDHACIQALHVRSSSRIRCTRGRPRD
jgi:hypothetical protein